MPKPLVPPRPQRVVSGDEALIAEAVVVTRLDRAIGWARKYSIFPYPFATADHQARNAEHFVRAGGAIENDVHVIGVSSQAAGHKTLVPQLIEELAKQGGSDVLVVVGGVIPAKDYDFLKNAGVAAIYGPGTNIPAAAAEILSILRQRGQKRAARRRTTRKACRPVRTSSWRPACSEVSCTT